jgi:ADP-heptose:LPS heptosyltransferase
MAESRFLIVRLGSLGDIVHTLPAVAALRESQPAATIVWLTHPRWKSLVESSGIASEVWPVETRSIRSLRETIGRIRKSSWDSSIDYQGLWKSAALPFLGGIKRRIGFSSDTIREFGVPSLYTDRVRVTKPHIVEQNGELSLRAGARRSIACVALRIQSSDEAAVRSDLSSHNIERYVVLSPGGGWRSKCWPALRYGALCRMIYGELGIRCVVNHSPGEEKMAEAVLSAADAANPLLYSGSLGQLMALLRNAMCIVGGDTGPLHLAIALGTPAVALFGPTDPSRNGPYRSLRCSAADARDDTVLRASGANTSYKRGDHPDPSMLAIDVEPVFDSLRRRIGDRA